MQSTWISNLATRLTLTTLGFLLTSLLSVAMAQENAGSEDLDKAFDQKIQAKSTRDLDAVVRLCESAIKKGLDEEGLVQAKTLAASTLYEHAEQLGRRILSSRGQDKRWRILRTQAISRLKKAVEIKPDMIDAFVLMAQLNVLPGGNHEQAKKAIDQAVEIAGEDRAQLSELLMLRASLSDDAEARISDLNQAIKINPDNHAALRVRAIHYLQTGETEKATKDIENWLQAGEDSTINYLNVIEELSQLSEEFEGSSELQKLTVDIIDQAIDNDPENEQLYLVRAQLNMAGENFDAAIRDVNRMIELQERNAGALMLRAQIYAQQEKLEEALADINKALEQEPLAVRAIQLRSAILAQMERFEDAIKDIELLAQNDPSDQFFQRQLASLYNANDQPSKAIKIYNELLEANSPEQWEGKSSEKQIVMIQRRSGALRGRGDAYLSNGKHVKAIADYEEVLLLDQELQKLLKQDVEAEEIPEDDGVLNNLAWVLATSPDAELRDGKRAIELATQAAEITEHKQAHILSTLASGYAETGDFENAIKWIEKAIEINRQEREENETPHNLRQKDSLQKEYENYQKQEPWRERENVEAENKGTEEDEKHEQRDDDSDDEAQNRDNEEQDDDEEEAENDDPETESPEESEDSDDESPSDNDDEK